MNPFIIDAHAHTGFTNQFFSPEVDAASLLKRMNQLNIQYAVNLVSMETLSGEQRPELEKSHREFEESGGRIFYCGFFDPRRGNEDITLLTEFKNRPGFTGIKIHPSFCSVSADDVSYEPVWRFAGKNSLPIVAHTWSVSSYNPVQKLSTPDKFEPFVRKYPGVKFVLGHSGGRGEGRYDAIRMAKGYENVYMDFGGDVFCYRYFEWMAEQVPENKILFGSDYPWLDQRAHLTRVYLADIPTGLKGKIFRENALEVFEFEK